MPTIRVPSALRSLTNGAAEIVVDAATVRDALVELDRVHPGLAMKLLDAAGSVKPFIRIYVGPEDIQALHGLDTKLAERDEIAIIPAIAGGGEGPALPDPRGSRGDGPALPDPRGRRRDA